MHTYRILQEICSDIECNIALMGGASKEHATFIIRRKVGMKLILNGLCRGSEVVLGIGSDHRTQFDLHSPDSISSIKEYLLGNHYRTAEI